MTGALSHLKVLDLSRILAGPWAGQLLADLGAETFKIERPGVGDDTRAWGPPFIRGADGEARAAAYFLCANRNKKSLAIDFTRPQGQAAIRTLPSEAKLKDIFDYRQEQYDYFKIRLSIAVFNRKTKNA